MAGERPLVIFDLDGTTGLYHLSPQLGRVYLRPGLVEALDALSDCRLALATRAEESYTRAVTSFLADRGVRFEGVYSRPQVALHSKATWAGYYKSYQGIQDAFDRTPTERTVIVGDLMTFDGVPVFEPSAYRRQRFAHRPSLLCTGTSLSDHPVDRRMVYVVVPQVLTRDRRGSHRSLSMAAVVRVLRRLLEAGGGSFLAGFQSGEPLGVPVERVRSDLLSQRMAAEVASGHAVECPTGRCLAGDLGHAYEPHRYLVVKGRRRDWSPVVEIPTALRFHP